MAHDLLTRELTYLDALRERAAQVAAGNGSAADWPVSAPGWELSRLLQMLWRSSVDGMVLSHRNSQMLVEVSDSFTALSGYQRVELLGRTAVGLGLINPDVVEPIADRHQRGASGHYETVLRRQDGTVRWVEFSHRLLGPDYVVTIVRDVTERHELEHELRRLADTDPLTGLLNRRRFSHEVDRELRAAHRYHDAVHLVALDLDGLKAINDRYGHPVGDIALLTVADVSATAIRDTDVAGRLGGDEFALMLTRCTREGARRVIDAIHERLRTLAVDVPAGPPLTLSVSTGIASPTSGQSTFNTLLARADADLYAMKRLHHGASQEPS